MIKCMCMTTFLINCILLNVTQCLELSTSHLLLQDVDLRQYNLQIPDKIIDEISDAVNYIRGYMGRG